VYLCVCVCVYVYKCICVYVCVCVHARKRVCVYAVYIQRSSAFVKSVPHATHAKQSYTYIQTFNVMHIREACHMI